MKKIFFNIHLSPGPPRQEKSKSPLHRNVSLLMLFLLFLLACHSKKAEEETTTEEQQTITPVTVTTISNEPMVVYLDVNMTSAFLQKASKKANATAYIRSVKGQVGKMMTAQPSFFT